MLNVSENSLSDLSLYNFKVDKSPLFAPHPVFNTPIPVPSTMSQAVIKEDGTVLGVVGPRTNIYNYKDTCEVVNESLGKVQGASTLYSAIPSVAVPTNQNLNPSGCHHIPNG